MLKRKWLWYPGFITIALAGILWMNQGCNGKIPPLPAVLQPTAAPPPYYITDFELGTTGVYSTLQGWNSGMIWQNTTYGGTAAAPNKVNNPFVVPNTVPDATDSSNFAIHVFAPLLATGIGNGYEADQLICPLYNAVTRTYYDASSFTGIQFLINIQADDTNTNPVFQIAIDQTEPPPALQGAAGGLCLAGKECNSHYQVPLLSYVSAGAGWQPVSLVWSAFSPAFAPNPITPNGSSLTSHLNKIVFLQWVFSDNVPGQIPPTATYTDYWVDNVQFLP